MQKDTQVKKIITYLEGKISSIREKLKQYDTPMMQEMAKNSPHLQMEYTRLTVELQANEDNLLAIRTFTSEPADPKPVRKNANGKKEKSAEG